MHTTRVHFGLTYSPAILGATIQHHVALFSGTQPEAVQILRRLYADDLSCSVDSSPQTFTLYQDCKCIMSQGAFNLRKSGVSKLFATGARFSIVKVVGANLFYI